MGIQLNVVNSIYKFLQYVSKEDTSKDMVLLNNVKCLNNVKKCLDEEKIKYNIKKIDSITEEEGKSLNKLLNKDLNIKLSKDKLVIAIGNDEKYNILAFYQAKLTDSDFILLDKFNKLVDFIEKSNYIYYTVITPQSNISVLELNRLVQIQRSRDYKNRPFYYGIMTARDVYTLNALIVKNHIYKNNFIKQYVVINRLDHKDEEYKISKEFSYLTFKTSRTEQVKSLTCNDSKDAITIIGHGRDDVVWLTDGALCGASKINKSFDINKEYNVPVCAYRNKCLYNDCDVIHIYDLHTRHFYSNSCKSSKLEKSVFNETFNLAYSFIEGYGISYIGCNSSIMGNIASNFYYMAQLKAGVSLGKIVYNISKIYQDKGYSITESCILLGDPTFRNNIDDKIYKYQLGDINDNGSQNKFTIDIQKDTEIVKIKLPIVDFDEKFYKLKWKVSAYSKNRRICGSYTREECNVYLELYSDRTLKKGDKIDLIISYNNEFSPQYIYRYQYFIELGYIDNKIKLPITEAKEVCGRLFGNYLYRINELDINNKEIYRKMEKLYLRLLNLSKLVVEYLVDKTHTKGISWEENLTTSGMFFDSYKDNNIEERCPSCGREIYKLKLKHMYNLSLNREQYHCPACGFIKDVPLTNKEDITVEFIDSNIAFLGQVCKQQIKISNLSDKVISGYCDYAIVSGKEHGVSYIKKGDKLIIKPGENKNIELQFMFSNNTDPHQYWLKVYVIGNGNIYVLKRDIWLRDNLK